ncbi:Dihydroxyacetone kinase, phosphotransfer subunit [Thermococcus barophilus]|uniref:Dihydroxyacetone kinase, phosphotransfer subunit n=2 Tax=Thermococcus barophilus TaxID=55802 RepID=A0A0S1XDZ6_THEBA|nr:Dihydroxyacetone kinase, phosphotransfer subunit [Thermococcus barophilus]
MCLQMAPGVKIEAVGGTKEGTLGIDAEEVFVRMKTLLKESREIVVLGDIGSTIMAAKNAIEMLGSPPNIRIADAPLVEGAIIAAVEASLGSPLEKVVKKAEETRFVNKL